MNPTSYLGLLSDVCKPRDSDSCLQASPDWSSSYNCKTSISYCDSWGRDMRRCCPESCNASDLFEGRTGVFTEDDCLSFDGLGSCTYPNEAQCVATRKLQKLPFYDNVEILNNSL